MLHFFIVHLIQGMFMIGVNNFPDHVVIVVPGYIWFLRTMTQTILECPGIFMMPVNHFPDHLVNVLDYSLCNGHLLRDIFGSSEQCPRPSLNVPGYL